MRDVELEMMRMDLWINAVCGFFHCRIRGNF